MAGGQVAERPVSPPPGVFQGLEGHLVVDEKGGIRTRDEATGISLVKKRTPQDRVSNVRDGRGVQGLAGVELDEVNIRLLNRFFRS